MNYQMCCNCLRALYLSHTRVRISVFSHVSCKHSHICYIYIYMCVCVCVCVREFTVICAYFSSIICALALKPYAKPGGLTWMRFTASAWLQLTARPSGYIFLSKPRYCHFGFERNMQTCYYQSWDFYWLFSSYLIQKHREDTAQLTGPNNPLVGVIDILVRGCTNTLCRPQPK